ncbi:MAG: hypothetical protein JWL83_69 [Actinomycetia bacterium]|nr:hypothetical protein [Actinomycetes bacterium]
MTRKVESIFALRPSWRDRLRLIAGIPVYCKLSFYATPGVTAQLVFAASGVQIEKVET